MKRIIDTPKIGDHRFKRWTKVISRVDTTKPNGFAFEGEFIHSKQELEDGSFILAWGIEGSRKHNAPLVRLYQVCDCPPSNLKLIYEKEALSDHWALDCRDEIAAIVNTAYQTTS